MRNLLYILILFPSLIFSQTVGFKYQAVVRNANGDLLVNQQVSFKTTILSGSSIGTEVFSETHTVGTNGYGVVNLNIGNGTAVSGSYSNIDWSSATHFLKTELDITGGNSFQFMGTSQILSVPYSEYADMSGSSMVDNDTSASNELQQLTLINDTVKLSSGGEVYLGSYIDNTDQQTLSLQGNQLLISGGNAINLTGTVDLDADPSNELQSLSLSNDTLYLSQGNNVVLPPDSDGDATNEIQVLSLSNDTLYLTSGGYVVLPPDIDGDATNEIQVLSLSNDTLYLTDGGYAVLPPDSDGDATNEIQVLTNTPGTISITNGNTITLEDSSAINEIQVLSRSNDTLYLTDGGFAILPQEIDSDTTNEIQTLSYSNDTLSISNGNNITINSSNFDFIYPDGKTGISPISFSTGVGLYAGAAWPFVEATLEVNYQVPTGKNLYIVNTSSGDAGYAVTPEILINGNLIFKTYSDVIGNNGSVYNSIFSPIILSAGDSLKMKPGKDINYNNNSTINNIIATKNSVNGFLVDKKVEVVTTSISSGQNYTVPTGKILVILNIQGNASLSSNNFNISGGGYNGYSSGSAGTYQTKILKNPLFFNENDVISASSSSVTVFNGYLINK